MKFLLILTLALSVLACGGTSETTDETTSVTEAAVTAEWIHDDLNGALAMAAETGKPVFVDMYADWCGPCVMLAEEYFVREDYKEVLSQCVLVKINIDNYQDLASRYSVQSIPTLLLMDSEGNELDRITGVMGSPEEFLPMIRSFIEQGL